MVLEVGKGLAKLLHQDFLVMHNTTKTNPDASRISAIIPGDFLSTGRVFSKLLVASCCLAVGCEGIVEQPEPQDQPEIQAPKATVVPAAEGLTLSVTPSGVSLNGLSLNGLSLNGLSLNGLSLNGLSLNGLSLNGLSLNGLALNGLALNGLSLNSLSLNGLSLNGL
ncbi:MAG TPA: hypothetical protein VNO30_23240, partial [Kofleriaceae bacterium]|nr:hypothetical protein [Kofleriaceae bacterium]